MIDEDDATSIGLCCGRSELEKVERNVRERRTVEVRCRRTLTNGDTLDKALVAQLDDGVLVTWLW
jgi:hypothetical protein